MLLLAFVELVAMIVGAGLVAWSLRRRSVRLAHRAMAQEDEAYDASLYEIAHRDSDPPIGGDDGLPAPRVSSRPPPPHDVLESPWVDAGATMTGLFFLVVGVALSFVLMGRALESMHLL